jgi:hypothetical protein
MFVCFIVCIRNPSHQLSSHFDPPPLLNQQTNQHFGTLDVCVIYDDLPWQTIFITALHTIKHKTPFSSIVCHSTNLEIFAKIFAKPILLVPVYGLQYKNIYNDQTRMTRFCDKSCSFHYFITAKLTNNNNNNKFYYYLFLYKFVFITCCSLNISYIPSVHRSFQICFPIVLMYF